MTLQSHIRRPETKKPVDANPPAFSPLNSNQENYLDPKIIAPGGASSTVARAIASLAADAKFCGFNVEGEHKIPVSTSGAGVSGATPAADLLTAANVLAGRPCPGAYWGVSMHTPTDQRGLIMVCLDLDTKRSGAPPDIRIKRLIEIAKAAGHLYERSHSMKGAHIWVMAPADATLPKSIKLSPGQEIEIFGMPGSKRTSVMLTGSEACGTLQAVKSLRQFLLDAGIDADSAPEPLAERPLTEHQKVEQSKVREMLAHIVNADLDYDDWLRICMAAKSAGGSFEDICAWSASSRKHDDSEFSYKWKSFTDKPDGVGLGTLKKIAYESGWEPEVSLEELRLASTDILVPLDESGARPISTVIKGVLPSDGIGMLWAPPASYKSFIAFDWLLCVASGTPWLGNIVKQGEVWLIAGEGHQGLAKRVKAWRQERDCDKPLRFLHSRSSVIIDGDEGEVAPGLMALLAMIERGHRPAVICVDTLNRSMAGDESSTRDATRYISAVTRLQDAMRRLNHDCCILLIHHARKQGDALRGSSVLLGAADFVYQIEKHSDLKISLHCDKWKDDMTPHSIDMEGSVVDLGACEDNHGDIVQMSSLVFWVRSEADIRAEKEAAKKDEAHAFLGKVRRALQHFGGRASKGEISRKMRDDGEGKREQEIRSIVSGLVRSGYLREVGSGPKAKIEDVEEW
jgi:hypothetical protein